jgi:hypothetical protein
MVRQFLQITLHRISARSGDPQTSPSSRRGADGFGIKGIKGSEYLKAFIACAAVPSSFKYSDPLIPFAQHGPGLV